MIYHQGKSLLFKMNKRYVSSSFAHTISCDKTITQFVSENRLSSSNKSSNSIKILSFNNTTKFNNWLSAIRLAKFGERLKTTFKKLNSQKQEYGKNIKFISQIVVNYKLNCISTKLNISILYRYELDQ